MKKTPTTTPTHAEQRARQRWLRELTVKARQQERRDARRRKRWTDAVSDWVDGFVIEQRTGGIGN